MARPTQSIELSTDATNVQVNFFESLGLGDPGRFEADLARVVELKAERERELAALAPTASTVEATDPPAVQEEDAEGEESAP